MLLYRLEQGFTIALPFRCTIKFTGFAAGTAIKVNCYNFHRLLLSMIDKSGDELMIHHWIYQLQYLLRFIFLAAIPQPGCNKRHAQTQDCQNNECQ
jgi:hypothetical protein